MFCISVFSLHHFYNSFFLSPQRFDHPRAKTVLLNSTIFWLKVKPTRIWIIFWCPILSCFFLNIYIL